MLSAKPRNVSAAYPLGTPPRVAIPTRQRRAHLPVIVHADDFGETVDITEGICLAIEAGVVTSTSVMANMPGTAEALRRAPQLAGQASFGVHLNLCEGRPLTQGSTLADADGRFLRKRALATRALSGKLSLRELEAEVTAQIGLLRDAGIRISHLDGHKHLHQLPIVCAVANVLPRFGIERVRITRLGGWTKARGAMTLAREIAARHAARVFQRANLRSPVRTVDLRDLMRGDALAEAAEPRGARGPEAIELCCHPGTAAADAGKPGSHRRGDELDYLLSPAFRAVLAASGAALVSYWRV